MFVLFVCDCRDLERPFKIVEDLRNFGHPTKNNCGPSKIPGTFESSQNAPCVPFCPLSKLTTGSRNLQEITNRRHGVQVRTYFLEKATQGRMRPEGQEAKLPPPYTDDKAKLPAQFYS